VRGQKGAEAVEYAGDSQLAAEQHRLSAQNYC